MFYSFEIPNNISIDVLKYDLKRRAKLNIFACSLNADELIIDKYLKEKYKLGLKELLYKLIIYKATYMNDTNALVIKWLNPEDDKLARLISYGTEKFKGSNILRDIFK